MIGGHVRFRDSRVTVPSLANLCAMQPCDLASVPFRDRYRPTIVSPQPQGAGRPCRLCAINQRQIAIRPSVATSLSRGSFQSSTFAAAIAGMPISGAWIRANQPTALAMGGSMAISFISALLYGAARSRGCNRSKARDVKLVNRDKRRGRLSPGRSIRITSGEAGEPGVSSLAARVDLAVRKMSWHRRRKRGYGERRARRASGHPE